MKDKLSPAQLKAVELMAENPSWSIQKVSEEMGKHYQTVYAWTKQQLFLDELDKQLHKIFEKGARVALNTMLSLAESGDRQAAQYILDNTGYKQADAVTVNSDTGLTINVKVTDAD